MQTQSEQRFATESIPKLMVTMAIPPVIAQVINILYNIVDRIYIGHIEGVGAAALTGVGVTFPIITLISAFSAFVGRGGAPLAAIWMGKGDQKHAEKILGNGALLLTIFSVLLMAVFLIWQRPLLYLFGASDATIGYACDYLTIYLLGTWFVQLALGLNPFIICQGKPRTAMLSIVIGAVINIVLDPIFIFVFGWGVQGAAIATVISQAMSAAWNVGFLMSGQSSIRLMLKNLKPEPRIIGQTFSLGISPFIMTSTESLVTIVLNSGMQRYGGDLYVGSITIMQSVLQLFSAPLTGFTQGVQPIISYNYGAGNFARTKKICLSMVGVSFTISFLANMTAMIFPGVYASLFSNDPELIALVGKVMPVFLFGMLFFGLQNGIQPSFLSLGQAGISLFIAMFRKVILLVPLALILPRFFGVMGIYYAEPVSDIISAATATVLFALNINRILSKEYLERIR